MAYIFTPCDPPVTVYTGNPPQFAGGWQDLDLSEAVGEQRVLAYLGIQSTSGGYFQRISTRMKGDPNEYARIQWDPAFGTTSRWWGYQGPRQTLAMWAPTDEFGIIQWLASAWDGSCTAKVYGYLTLNYEDTLADTVEALNTWQTVDLSSVIGSQRAFVVLRVRGDDVNSYEGYKMVRSTTYEMGYLTRGAGLCRIKSHATPTSRCAATVSLITNTSGQVEVKDYTNRPGFYANYDVLFWAPFQSQSAVLVFNGTSSTTPRTIDLSPYVGARRALVNLLVYGPDINTSSAVFWPSGDSEPWGSDVPDVGSLNNATVGGYIAPNYGSNQAQVVTNDEGKIDWVGSNDYYNVRIYLFGYAAPLPLIAHWPIDDSKDRESTTVRDIAEGGSGNHDGVVRFGYYTYWQPGGVGGRHLGDVNTYGGETTISNNPDDFRVTGDMTIMIWGACDQYSGWNDYITLASCTHDNDGDPANNSLWAFDVHARHLRFFWWDSVSAWLVIETANPVLSRQGFHHFAAARYEISPGSPGTYGVRFYVNGELVEDADNGGAGYLGPTGGGNAIMYLCRRKDFILTYQSNLWYDSARFYNGAVDDQTVADVYAEELPKVHPGIFELLPDIHESEETEEGSIYEAQELTGDSHTDEAGVGGDEYSDVEAEPGESRTDDVGDYDALATGPLSIKARSGWWRTA